jgi:hypothetical protein
VHPTLVLEFAQRKASRYPETLAMDLQFIGWIRDELALVRTMVLIHSTLMRHGATYALEGVDFLSLRSQALIVRTILGKLRDDGKKLEREIMEHILLPSGSAVDELM